MQKIIHWCKSIIDWCAKKGHSLMLVVVLVLSRRQDRSVGFGPLVWIAEDPVNWRRNHWSNKPPITYPTVISGTGFQCPLSAVLDRCADLLLLPLRKAKRSPLGDGAGWPQKRREEKSWCFALLLRRWRTSGSQIHDGVGTDCKTEGFLSW